jgi:hypothetical protein
MLVIEHFSQRENSMTNAPKNALILGVRLAVYAPHWDLGGGKKP